MATKRKARTLKQALEEIRAIDRKIAVGQWELGRAITAVYVDKLYRERFPTFTAFCLEALRMSPHHARQLMRVAATFTRSAVVRVGIGKLALLARMKSEVQREYLVKLMRDPESVTSLQLAEVLGWTKGRSIKGRVKLSVVLTLEEFTRLEAAAKRFKERNSPAIIQAPRSAMVRTAIVRGLDAMGL